MTSCIKDYSYLLLPRLDEDKVAKLAHRHWLKSQRTLNYRIRRQDISHASLTQAHFHIYREEC